MLVAMGELKFAIVKITQNVQQQPGLGASLLKNHMSTKQSCSSALQHVLQQCTLMDAAQNTAKRGAQLSTKLHVCKGNVILRQCDMASASQWYSDGINCNAAATRTWVQI
jgi:hypothetical protein